MKFLIVLLALGTVVLCVEENRHFAFYGQYYRPPPPPPPPRYNVGFDQRCCSSSALQLAGCVSSTTLYGARCACCVKSYYDYMRYSAACTAYISSLNTASATVVSTAAPVTTTAAAATTTVATTTTTEATTTPTTTTTEVPTTTPEPFCPNSGCTRRKRAAYSFLKALRIQGGSPISSTCDYPGVVAVQAEAPTGDVLTICTGALISATEIQIPSNCGETLNLAGATNDKAIVDGREIAISSVSSATPLSIATLSEAVDVTAAPSLACVYDAATMGSYDKSTCEIVGYGTDASGNPQSVAQVAKITSFDASACSGIDKSLNVASASYNCAVLDNAATCAGDGGALIVCSLYEPAGKKVLIGQAETFDCDTGTPAVYFQNFDV